MLEFFKYRVGRGTLRTTSVDSTKYVIKQFMRENGQETVRTVTKTHAENFFRNLRNEGRAAATRNTYLARLKSFWDFLFKFNKTDLLIFGDIDMDSIPPHQLARDEWLETAEIRKLMSKCSDKRLTFVMMCGFGCGLRKREIIMSRPHWFDLENERLNVIHTELTTHPVTGEEFYFRTKSGTNKSIPLPAGFVHFLKNEFPFREKQDWCLEPTRRRKTVNKKYRWDFRRPLEEFFKLNGILNREGTPQSTHFMRHSFASNCVRNNKLTIEIASWMGIRERTVEQHYAHVRSQKGALDNII
jgi:integrase